MSEDLKLHPSSRLFMTGIDQYAGKTLKLLKSNLRPNKAIRQYRVLMLELDSSLRDNTACGSCSDGFCCSMPTTISSSEAERIKTMYGYDYDKSAGVAPDVYQARPILTFEDRIPCVFFKDKKCAVYDARPVNCILHYNLCETNEGCRTIDGKTIMLGDKDNAGNITSGGLLRSAEPTLLANSGVYPKVGDIREFFKDVKI